MSLDITAERVCYVHCNFCNTILAHEGYFNIPSWRTYISTNPPPACLGLTSHLEVLVSVPCSSMCAIVTVRCGHCANLLSVSMGALLQTPPLQDVHQLQKQQSASSIELHGSNKEYMSGLSSSSSSKCINNFSSFKPPAPPPNADHDPPRLSHIRPPEKRQRVPSAYNRFIKEEIQRIKTSNPEITHREAFSTAAKNWAHLPHIHFGLKLEGNKQMKLDHAVGGEGTQKSNIVSIN